MKNILTCFALSVMALLTSACFDSSTAQTPGQGSAQTPEIPVIAEALRFERHRVRIEAVGTSRARLSAELYAPTSGEVVAVDITPGQAVKAGDVLVRLDAEKERLAVRLAEIRLEEAERLYKRYQKSASSGAVLPTAVDSARLAAETGRVELQQARIALADRAIKAVFDGHVGGTDIDPGDRVDSSMLITTLDDRSSLLVSFDVPENFIGEFASGDAVQLATWNSTKGEIAGVITDIASRIDPNNRTFTVRARVDNQRDKLRPGMSFRARTDVLGELYGVVSETGLQWGADGAYVWAVVDGLAQRVPVQVVQRREGRVLVDGELGDGAVIVVEGTQRMRPGIAVSQTAPRVATGGGSTIIALD